MNEKRHDRHFKKAKTMDLSTLNNIAVEMLPEIRTNIKSGSMLKLMAGIRDTSLTGMRASRIKYPEGCITRMVSVPETLKSNVKELTKRLSNKKIQTHADGQGNK